MQALSHSLNVGVKKQETVIIIEWMKNAFNLFDEYTWGVLATNQEGFDRQMEEVKNPQTKSFKTYFKCGSSGFKGCLSPVATVEQSTASQILEDVKDMIILTIKHCRM